MAADASLLSRRRLACDTLAACALRSAISSSFSFCDCSSVPKFVNLNTSVGILENGRINVSKWRVFGEGLRAVGDVGLESNKSGKRRAQQI